MEGINTYVHIAMFADIRRLSSKDVYKDCIRNLVHKYTARRKILLGVNMRSRGAVRHPHLFDSISLAPRNKVLIINTGVAMSKASTILLGATNDEEKYVLDMDLNSYGYHQRSLTLGLDDENAFTFIQRMQYTETMGRNNDHSISYPHDLLCSNKERKRVLDVDECAGLPTLSQRLKRQRTVG